MLHSPTTSELGNNETAERINLAKILLVEDHPDLRETVALLLEGEHHTVDAVQDGDAGLEHVLAYEFDLIILDWVLPGLSGVEILKRLRARGRSTPVLMLTGKEHIENKVQGF